MHYVYSNVKFFPTFRKQTPPVSTYRWFDCKSRWPTCHNYLLTNLVNRLHEKQNVKRDPPSRVTLFDGRITLLSSLIFPCTYMVLQKACCCCCPHTNTLARPAGSTRSRRDNQSMRERCWLEQRPLHFSHIQPFS